MIDVSKCNSQASKLEDAATNIDSIIKIFEDSYYTLNTSSSTSVKSFKTDINAKISILEQLKSDLRAAASTIRTKAQEIYNRQKAEEEARKRAEEEARQQNQNQ